MSSRLHVGIPKPSETEPLYDQRSSWAHRQGRPTNEDWRSSQHQPLIPLVTTVPAELHPPVQSAEETEHDGAVCDLNAQRAIEESKSNSRVDVRESSLGCETSLFGEIDYSGGRAKIGECPGKSENEVRCGNGARDRFGDTKLRKSYVTRCSNVWNTRCKSIDLRNSIVCREGRSPLPYFLQQSTSRHQLRSSQPLPGCSKRHV
jgi:hypothetical protein